MPSKCPIDSSVVVRDGLPAGRQGVAYRCPNPECAGRFKENIYHFVGRSGFNLEGIGPKVIDRLLDECLINDAGDIFSLKIEDIKDLERFGEQSATNLVSEAQSKKNIALPKFIYSLGILHVGEETALALARAIFNSQFSILKPKDILDTFLKLEIENLKLIRDIGPAVSQSIVNWFKETRNIQFIEKLDAVGIKIENLKLNTSAGGENLKLSGKTFVLTGTLSAMDREMAKEKIRSLGGSISESVSSKTSYVVAGTEAGSKLAKALKLSVPVLTEDEFLKLIK
jgi:DNA ligase (NAD+)